MEDLYKDTVEYEPSLEAIILLLSIYGRALQLATEVKYSLKAGENFLLLMITLLCEFFKSQRHFVGFSIKQYEKYNKKVQITFLCYKVNNRKLKEEVCKISKIGFDILNKCFPFKNIILMILFLKQI